MIKRTTTLINMTGLHARPASDFIACAKRYDANITIEKADSGKTVNAKSIVMLLSLGLSKGDNVTISASGADEQEAVEALVSLITSGFGEEDM